MHNSMNIKQSDTIGASHGYRHTFLNNQKGALLVALIVTIVVLSILGGGLVYIFSSSALNPVSGNYAQRAYYNAEAGFRFVTSLYRATSDKTIFTTTYNSVQTLSLPGGGSVTVLATSPTTSVSTTTSDAGSGSSLNLTSVSGFQTPMGFFTIGTGTTIYHYTGISGTTLTGIFPVMGTTIAAGTTIKTKEQTTITSVGTYPVLGNLWDVSRKVSYVWPLSGASTGTPTALPSTINTFDVNNWRISGATTAFSIFTGGLQNWANLGLEMAASPFFSNWGLFNWQDNAIRVISADKFFLPYDYDFYNTRQLTTNKTLSYDAQTKIRVGGGEDYTANNYLVGISTRSNVYLIGTTWYNNQFGFSYAKGNNSKFNIPTSNDIYMVFWRSVGNSFKLIAYKKLTKDEGIIQWFETFTDPMDTTPNNWSASGDCDINWSQSTTVGHGATTTSRQVKCTSPPFLGNDSATLTRTVNFPNGLESAKISFWYKKGSYFSYSRAKLQMNNSSGTFFDVPGSDFTPTDTWQYKEVTLSDNILYTLRTDSKIRFYADAHYDISINYGKCDFYIDDVQISSPYVKLVDWATLGVRVREKVTPSRSNEFEVFFGHPTGNNGSGPSTAAVVDVNRSNNARDQISWPPVSPINSLNAGDDKFTFVSSDTNDPYSSVNPWYWYYDSDGDYTSSANGASYPTTSARTEEDGCSYTLVTGGTFEPYAVIKTSGTNCLTTDQYYTSGSDPVEFGLHVYSPATYDTWFDDIGIQLTSGTAPYVPAIQY
jgi:hypothetical protein